MTRRPAFVVWFVLPAALTAIGLTIAMLTVLQYSVRASIHGSLDVGGFSSLATWGKLRALADNPDALSAYCTLYPNPGNLLPIMCSAMKKDYSEHLMDGLFVLHNPFARHPLPSGLLSHPRLCEVNVVSDGELIMTAPDDFLLLRMIKTMKVRDLPEQA